MMTRPSIVGLLALVATLSACAGSARVVPLQPTTETHADPDRLRVAIFVWVPRPGDAIEKLEEGFERAHPEIDLGITRLRAHQNSLQLETQTI